MPDVASLDAHETIAEEVVTIPFGCGDLIDNTGAVVSTRTTTDCEPVLPRRSTAVTSMVCEPSERFVRLAEVEDGGKSVGGPPSSRTSIWSSPKPTSDAAQATFRDDASNT